MRLMLAAVVLPAVAAGQAVSLDEVIGKVRSGVGREAWPASGVRMAGTIQFLGVPERCTLTMGSGGSYLLEQSGEIPLTRSCGAKGPWMVDIGGEVRMLSLGDAERGRLLGAALTGSWLDGGGGFAWTVDEAKGNEDRVVLAFTLKDGVTTGEVSIDRKTWRPSRWTMRAGAKTDIITFEGAVMLGGAWLPGKVTVAGEASEAVYEFAEAAAAPMFFRSPYEPASLKPTDITFDAAPAVVESKRAKTGHTLVKVAVDGREGWFIFDTGAGGTVIDAAFADAAGLQKFGQVSAVGVGGAVPASFVRAKAFRVGAATQAGALMSRLDLSGIGKAMGTPVDGVLGFNIMHRAVTRISTADGSVALYDPAAFDAASKDWGLVWHKLVDYDRHACVEGEFEGHRGWFTLDTGAGMQPVSMHAPAVRQFKLLDGREVTDAKAGGVGGNVAMKAGKLRWLVIGGRREEDVPALFAVEDKGAFGNPFTAGHLSLKQLGPRDAVFDYAGGRVAFPDPKPGG